MEVGERQRLGPSMFTFEVQGGSGDGGGGGVFDGLLTSFLITNRHITPVAWALEGSVLCTMYGQGSMRS